MASTIYLASGYAADLQEVFARAYGVEDVRLGFANPSKAYSDANLADGESDAALCIKVSYNPKLTEVGNLLQLFFKLIDPYAPPDVPQSRTGVYYEQGEDIFQIEYYFRFLRLRGAEPVTTDSNIVMNDSVTHSLDTRELMTELQRLERFVPAPEEQQFYLSKHPEAKRFFDLAALAADGLIEKQE